MRLGGLRKPFGPEITNIGVSNAAKLALAEMLFEDIYGGDRRREAADTGDLAPVNVLGWLEVLLFKVGREIEERHVLLR